MTTRRKRREQQKKAHRQAIQDHAKTAMQERHEQTQTDRERTRALRERTGYLQRAPHTQQHHHRHGQPNVQAAHDQLAQHDARQTDDGTDAEVNAARDDHQRHPEGQKSNLCRKAGHLEQVGGGQERWGQAGHDDEGHDQTDEEHQL